jgi:DNA-binding MarR family transcriptional regulator
VAERTEVDASIIASYRTIARALDRVMLPRLIELGISMPQFKALIAVVTAGPGGISVTQLGSELSIGQPSASLIVDQLVRPGYVERIPDTIDRRRVLVTATALGVELTGELRHGRRSTFTEWLANVAEPDAEALEQGLRGLAFAVQASPAGRAPIH